MRPPTLTRARYSVLTFEYDVIAPLSSVRAQLFLTIQPRGEAHLNSELGMPEGRADFSSVKELLFPLRLSTAGVSDRSPVEVHILIQHRGAPTCAN